MLRIEGSKIITQSGYEVTEPSVLFDKTGVFHKFGNYEDLLPVFNTWREADVTGLISKDLVFMVFDKANISLEEIKEIVEKMMSTSGYCKVFYEELLKNTLKEEGIKEENKNE